MLRIGTPRSSQISLTQDMSSNEEVLSNSIAFMKHPQDGKEILLYFAEKEKKKEIREKKKRKSHASGYLILQSNQARKMNSCKNPLLFLCRWLPPGASPLGSG